MCQSPSLLQYDTSSRFKAVRYLLAFKSKRLQTPHHTMMSHHDDGSFDDRVVDNDYSVSCLVVIPSLTRIPTRVSKYRSMII
jgi:hypothetical protein